jgi:hypothetical protein
MVSPTRDDARAGPISVSPAMPLPRVRITVGRMMIAVAVAALLLTWWLGQAEERRRRFRFLSDVYAADAALDPTGPPDTLAAKYEWAARYPWLPVWPDPD